MTDSIMVSTAKGLLERSRLHAKDVVFEETQVRTIATEWYIRGREDEGYVRRDVWVNVLKPALTAESA